MEEAATNGTAVNNGVIKLSNYCHPVDLVLFK
jgi:hypothetical protein